MSSHSERPRTRWQGYAALTVLFLLSLPLVTPRLYASDEVQYFAYLRSLWFDRDVSFENEYRYFYESGVTRFDGFRETFLERETETGHRISFATMGAAILWSPFYAVAHVMTRLRGSPTVSADGYSAPYVMAVAYGSAVYGWLAVLISYWMAAESLRPWLSRPERWIGDVAPSGAALAVWIGTPLIFYMYIAPPMAHACSAFAVAAFLAAWLRVRRRWSWGGWAVLGALAGLVAMVREQDVFVIAGPALDWIWTTWRRHADGSARIGWQTIVGPLAGLAALLLVYSPQLWAYTILNGYPGPSRLVGRKMNWMAPHALGVLFSPNHGLFFWTPLALLAVTGLLRCQTPLRTVDDLKLDALSQVSRSARERRGPRPSLGRRPARHLTVSATFGRELGDARQICACLLVVFLSQVYVAGSVESWTVAGAFGQRRFVGLTSVFVVGLAACYALARTRGSRIALVTATAVCVWWNIGLMAQFGAGLMDRQRLDLPRNAYHTFVTVPARLPELAYRYLFERTSFFRPRAA